jgi:hypothetical protein
VSSGRKPDAYRAALSNCSLTEYAPGRVGSDARAAGWSSAG